jgi:hypothetical protein
LVSTQYHHNKNSSASIDDFYFFTTKVDSTFHMHKQTPGYPMLEGNYIERAGMAIAEV